MQLEPIEIVCDRLGISRQRAYELVRTKILPPGVVIRLGRQVRVNPEALEEWIRSGGQALPGIWRHDRGAAR